MKDWVKPYLLEQQAKTLDDLDLSSERRILLVKAKHRELESDEWVCCELIDCLITEFGSPMGTGWAFICAFGSVLGDLPKEVFIKLTEMSNLVFTFSEQPGAMVKMFPLENDIKADRLYVVTFPHESIFMPLDVVRGEVVHELAHIYARHKPIDRGEREDEADNLARKWGFEKEIEALREYEKEHWNTKEGGD